MLFFDPLITWQQRGSYYFARGHWTFEFSCRFYLLFFLLFYHVTVMKLVKVLTSLGQFEESRCVNHILSLALPCPLLLGCGWVSRAGTQRLDFDPARPLCWPHGTSLLGELFINPSYTLAHHSFTLIRTHTHTIIQAYKAPLEEKPAHPSADTFLPRRLN